MYAFSLYCVNDKWIVQFAPSFLNMDEKNKNSLEQQTVPKENKGEKWSFMEMAKFVIISAIIVLPIRFFIAEPYIVRQTSMNPTFIENDYLIVEKISSRAKNPERGDVIIFKSPIEKGKVLIKRVIGLPGEIINIEENDIKISEIGNDQKEKTFELSEPYIVFNSPNISKTFKLLDDEYFVAGDNRPASFDSRIWGPIKKSDIIGRLFLRLYRFDAINFLPGVEKKK